MPHYLKQYKIKYSILYKHYTSLISILFYFCKNNVELLVHLTMNNEKSIFASFICVTFIFNIIPQSYSSKTI